MRILLVSATLLEIRPFLTKLAQQVEEDDRIYHYQLKNTSIDVLIPGIGMVQTAYYLGKQLAGNKYDLAINAGICGSFNRDLRIGDVVEIVEDCISELGAEDKDRFLSIFDLGLLDPDSSPYTNGKLITKPQPKIKNLKKLPKVKGITVNTVHGNKQSIEGIRSLFSPETESMEGAAFLYSCILTKVPNVQIRAVSNFVEERDRSRWNLDLALNNLNKVLEDLFLEICV